MQSINSNDVDFFIALETRVWSALAAGDVAADESLLADDFLGVYSSGTAGKADHASQLKDGPTVGTFSLSNAQIQILAEDVVLLTYLAHWTRRNAPDKKEAMYITSIWRETNGAWLNIFSQDTQADDHSINK